MTNFLFPKPFSRTKGSIWAAMFNAFVRFRGGSSVVMIGTDSPTFPPEFIARAFGELGLPTLLWEERRTAGFINRFEALKREF